MKPRETGALHWLFESWQYKLIAFVLAFIVWLAVLVGRINERTIESIGVPLHGPQTESVEHE
ncbi:MAG: hypothetical protein H6626_04545 [Pseudobdellovibrionaceae bacterium]|nr:hypothetical protein [Bdellovibrionales bacterium]USN48364.1 MAG: hypothetical protein H6626_04545 [Pseudobdellovibrionaceae bacterium]